MPGCISPECVDKSLNACFGLHGTVTIFGAATTLSGEVL